MRINLKQRLQNLKVLAALANFLQEPGQLESVFKIASSMKESDLSNYMRDTLVRNPEMRTLISERWQPIQYSAEGLKNLPQGTLGNAYANQMISLNLSADDLLTNKKIETDKDYIELRARQTHDIIHVITGFGTDEVGEIGLQAFNLAQIKSPVSALIIFGGILTALKRQSKFSLDDLLIKISEGFKLARNAEILLTKKLEEEWETNLEELRIKYRIAINHGTGSQH